MAKPGSTPLNPRLGLSETSPDLPVYEGKRGKIGAFPGIMHLYCALDASAAGFS
jgi:hypothetical protein